MARLSEATGPGKLISSRTTQNLIIDRSKNNLVKDQMNPSSGEIATTNPPENLSLTLSQIVINERSEVRGCNSHKANNIKRFEFKPSKKV